jgi:DNA-binding Xre family transcriptional regulator
MNSSEYMNALIKKQYKSIRQFALAINVPYSTIKSGLNAGIGGMAVDTVIKMCNALNIRVEDLKEFNNKVPDELTEIGVEWMALTHKYKKLGLTPQQVEKIIDALNDIKRS